MDHLRTVAQLADSLLAGLIAGTQAVAGLLADCRTICRQLATDGEGHDESGAAGIPDDVRVVCAYCTRTVLTTLPVDEIEIGALAEHLRETHPGILPGTAPGFADLIRHFPLVAEIELVAA
jgi:hypothetical protein